MIPNPLLDRMEVIAIAGYITDEKRHIARDYLEKSTRETCGIKPEQVCLNETSLVASHLFPSHLSVEFCAYFSVPIFEISEQTSVGAKTCAQSPTCSFFKRTVPNIKYSW